MSAPWPAMAHLTLFLVGSAGWMVLLGTGAAVILTALDRPLDDPAALGGVGLAAFSVAQTAGMVALAAALARRLPEDERGAFPLAASPAAVGVGLAAGLVLWTLPSWLADVLGRVLPTGSLALIAEGLTSGPVADRVALGAAIAVAAPVLEELVFRGYLWRVCEGAGRTAALLGTTALFCAWHFDAVQSLALVPTALGFGWLRLRSGSVAPSIGAHLVNNALGVALIGVDAPLSLPVAVAGAALTAGLLAGTDRLLTR